LIISIILAHPDSDSFNHAIANTCKDALLNLGHEVVFHDLCRENFDPLLPRNEFEKDAPLPQVIQEHCDEIANADGIIIVHPNWWGMPPAILKGWIDRVIRPGVAYKFEEGDCGESIPRGLLNAKAALIFNTANTSDEREFEIFGDPLESLWTNCIFGLCGVPNIIRRTFTIVVTSSEKQRVEWLSEIKSLVEHTFH